MNQVQIDQSVLGSGRRVAGAIKSLVKAMNLQLVRVMFLDEILLVPVLTHVSETILWKERTRM